jgi:hypothetical protein
MNNKKPVIPVFGAYFNGNFGDDLMGHLIASRLADSGYHPRLWRGPDNTFRGRKWETASTMDEFVKGAKCVVFGGGLPFCNSDFTPYWEAISEMVDVCEKETIPIIAISVGSHGHHNDMHPAAVKLVGSPMFKAASLRLQGDVEWLRATGKDVEYVPDIVLTAMPYQPRTRISHVLLCMTAGLWDKLLLDRLVCRLRRRGFTVSTIAQFADGFDWSERYYHGKGTKIVNSGPDSVTEAIRDADVVVATGLHIGITALSGGAEFVSVRTAGKTASFMKQCGREGQTIAPKNKFERVFSYYRLYKILTQIVPKKNDVLFRAQCDAAEGHYRFMLERLDRIYGTVR